MPRSAGRGRRLAAGVPEVLGRPPGRPRTLPRQRRTGRSREMNHTDTDGTLYTENGLFVLRFERHLAHPALKVWLALTDAAALHHWFPQDVTADLRPGGKMLFSFRN